MPEDWEGFPLRKDSPVQIRMKPNASSLTQVTAEEFKANVMKVWNDPRVQKQVDAVEDFVKEKAPEVAEFVSDGAKKVVAQVSGKKSTAPKPRARTSSTPRASSTPKS